MSSEAAPHSFLTIRWSLVHRVVATDDPGAQTALAQLCGACWFPIYAYIRRSGKSAHDAEDLTQASSRGYSRKISSPQPMATRAVRALSCSPACSGTSPTNTTAP